MKRDARGFTLVEFVVGIVFLGVVLGPLLAFVARIHDLNSAVGQQARREAWRSFEDQAVAVGIDPTLAPGLGAAVNVSVPAMPARPIAAVSSPAVPGLPRLVPLQVTVDLATTEHRMSAAGYQIGAGTIVAPRGTPTPPLDPIVMPRPVMAPADGAVVGWMDLVDAGDGRPYSLGIQATAMGGTTVRAILNQPFASFQGAGEAHATVNAADLAQGVNGAAWTEYAGDTAFGDRSVQLGDGRTRWLVTTSEKRLQIYEPSPAVRFAYQLSLGAPVLLQAGNESADGATIGFDYAGYIAMQTGTSAMHIDFPAATKAVFGNTWTAQAIGFQCTFAGQAGPFSGDMAGFFDPDALSLWSDSLLIVATPVVPPGIVANTATWGVTRKKSPLAAPILASQADSAGFYSAGSLEFSAPKGPDGTPVGRLSFENGSALSTGTTLSISVLP